MSQNERLDHLSLCYSNIQTQTKHLPRPYPSPYDGHHHDSLNNEATKWFMRPRTPTDTGAGAITVLDLNYGMTRHMTKQTPSTSNTEKKT